MRLAIAAFIVFAFVVRFPDYFLHPQLWAEDGIIWRDAYVHGIASVWLPLAGYSNLLARLIAIFANAFPIEAVPTVYFCASLSLTVMAALWVSSERTDLPHRGIIAVAIVCVSQGSSILGTAANTQWLAPFFLFIPVVSQPPKTLFARIAEPVALIMFGLTGPYSILILPLFALRLFYTRERRDLMNTLLVAVCAAIQIITIVDNSQTALPLQTHWTISTVAGQFNEFWRLFLSPFSNALFAGRSGAIVSAILLLCVVFAFGYYIWTISRRRFELVCVLLFAVALLAAGLYKVGMQDRYIYAPQVLAVMAVAIVASSLQERAHGNIMASVATLLFVSLLSQAHSGHFDRDYRWSEYAQRLRAGQQVDIPIAPDGWLISVPARGAPH